MYKLIDLKEAKANLSEFVDQAQGDRVLITRGGKPAALVIGVEGQDMEQVILGSDPDFWNMIHERRKRTPTLTSEDIRRSFGIDTAGGPRGTARAKRRRGTQRRRAPRTKD